MKNNLVKTVSLVMALSIISPVTVFAENNQLVGNDLDSLNQTQFENVISEIESIKEKHPEYTEEVILATMNERHPDIRNSGMERGIIDIWNVLTDSEKNYVFGIHLML